jgi:hypothetical protein
MRKVYAKNLNGVYGSYTVLYRHNTKVSPITPPHRELTGRNELLTNVNHTSFFTRYSFLQVEKGVYKNRLPP